MFYIELGLRHILDIEGYDTCCFARPYLAIDLPRLETDPLVGHSFYSGAQFDTSAYCNRVDYGR